MIRRYLPLIAYLIISMAAIVTGYFLIRPEPGLPVYQPADVNPNLVPADLRKVTRRHRISTFSLTDQLAKKVTEADLKGKIVLADFFFVTCPSICPKMTTEMGRVHRAFRDNPEVILVSHTVMPEHDSVPVLRHYADSIGADHSRWLFLTGPKPEIYRLARRDYLVVTSEGEGDSHDFIHTENLVLVDAKGRIRGYYDGTSPEDTEKAIEDIRWLLTEGKER